MTGYSRRQLAKYAAEELAGGRGGPKLAKELASALQSSGRVKQADLLVSDIYQELEERGLSAKAVISSARPLNEALEREIVKNIKVLANVDSVSIDSVVDESLLGGIKIQTANHQWDSTIRTRLRAIREAV